MNQTEMKQRLESLALKLTRENAESNLDVVSMYVHEYKLLFKPDESDWIHFFTRSYLQRRIGI